MLDVSTAQCALRSDGPNWEGQDNWVLGNLAIGMEAELSPR